MALSNSDKKKYIEDVIVPSFMHIVEQKIFSTIYDYNYEVVIATNHTAQSVGFDSWQEVRGLGYKNYADSELAARVFGASYNDKTRESIHKTIKIIYEIQQLVFKSQKVVNFIDLLPYNNRFKAYLEIYIPLYHYNGEMIAIQSFSVPSKFFSHQDYLQQLTANDFHHKYMDQAKEVLTRREHEIMFLLANAISQEQIAQILGVSRSTIATIITKLSAKFGIPGSSTKLLGQIAIQHGYHQDIPPSLYQPHIIILDDDILRALQLDVQE